MPINIVHALRGDALYLAKFFSLNNAEVDKIDSIFNFFLTHNDTIDIETFLSYVSPKKKIPLLLSSAFKKELSYDEFFVYICFLTLMPRPFYYQLLLSTCHISPFTPITKVQILYFKSIIECSIDDNIILNAIDVVSGKRSSFITFEQFLALDQIIPDLFAPLESIRNQYRSSVFTIRQYYNIMYRHTNINEIRNYYEIHHSYPTLSCVKYIHSLFSEFGNPYKYDYILTADEITNHKCSLSSSIDKNNNNQNSSKRMTRNSGSGFISDDYYCYNNCISSNNNNSNMNTSRIEMLVKTYCRIANPPYCKLRIDESNNYMNNMNIKPLSISHNTNRRQSSSSCSTKIIKPSCEDTTIIASTVKSDRMSQNIIISERGEGLSDLIRNDVITQGGMVVLEEKGNSSKSGKESTRSSIVTVTQTRGRSGTDGALDLESQLHPLNV